MCHPMQDERDKDAGTAIRLVSSGRGDAGKGGFSPVVKCTVPEQAAEERGVQRGEAPLPGV